MKGAGVPQRNGGTGVGRGNARRAGGLGVPAGEAVLKPDATGQSPRGAVAEAGATWATNQGRTGLWPGAESGHTFMLVTSVTE